MKVKNLNNSSAKTRELIKETFVKMLSETREIDKVTVSGLAARANISRATFYTHFDDIYGVAEEFKEELVDNFFLNADIDNVVDYEEYFDAIFAFIKLNDENYKIFCKSNDVLFAANRLTALFSDKFLEIALNDKRIKNRDNIELEIRIFFEGSLLEYVKYCRGQSSFTLDDMHAFAKDWRRRFVDGRCV